jgi:hypothetical protein
MTAWADADFGKEARTPVVKTKSRIADNTRFIVNSSKKGNE